MQTVVPGQVVRHKLRTLNAAGVPTALAAPPAYALWRNATTTVPSGEATPAVTSPSAGVYVVTYTVPAAGVWATGDVITPEPTGVPTMAGSPYPVPSLDPVQVAAARPGELSAGERAAVATALLDLADGVEAGVTPRRALRRLAAMLAGDNTGAGTSTEVFKAAGNPGTTRATVAVDSLGNRQFTWAD